MFSSDIVTTNRDKHNTTTELKNYFSIYLNSTYLIYF